MASTTITEKLAALEAELAEIKALACKLQEAAENNIPEGLFVPGNGEKYISIAGSTHTIETNTWREDCFDAKALAKCNVFKSEAEAKAHNQRMQEWAKLDMFFRLGGCNYGNYTVKLGENGWYGTYVPAGDALLPMPRFHSLHAAEQACKKFKAIQEWMVANEYWSE